MAIHKLAEALQAVDWNQNVSIFLANQKSAEKTFHVNFRLALWSKQFENADINNPALSFIREMQMSGQHVAVLVALSLYKPAASSMRAMFETALYYTYFRTHHSELGTLFRDTSYHIEKRELIEYHKRHTSDFQSLQQKLGLLSRVEKWYSEISSIIHGKVPGTWVDHKSVKDINNIEPTQEIALEKFVEGEEIIHRLFLCTAGRLLWDSFSSPAKKQLLSGLKGGVRSALMLDTA